MVLQYCFRGPAFFSLFPAILQQNIRSQGVFDEDNLLLPSSNNRSVSFYLLSAITIDSQLLADAVKQRHERNRRRRRRRLLTLYLTTSRKESSLPSSDVWLIADAVLWIQRRERNRRCPSVTLDCLRTSCLWFSVAIVIVVASAYRSGTLYRRRDHELSAKPSNAVFWIQRRGKNCRCHPVTLDCFPTSCF